MSTKWTVTFDCAQPAALAEFWCLALGYVAAAPPTGFASWPEWFAHYGVPEEERGDGAYIEDPDGARPRISFLKVPEGKVVKNRMHVDVLDPSPGAVDQLISLGATVAGRHEMRWAGHSWTVVQDPGGNEFCVGARPCTGG
jgi:hypothetical protein